MTDLCLRVAEATPVNGLETLLPQYNCLFLSPARFWHQDKSEWGFCSMFCFGLDHVPRVWCRDKWCASEMDTIIISIACDHYLHRAGVIFKVPSRWWSCIYNIRVEYRTFFSCSRWELSWWPIIIFMHIISIKLLILNKSLMSFHRQSCCSECRVYRRKTS